MTNNTSQPRGGSPRGGGGQPGGKGPPKGRAKGSGGRGGKGRNRRRRSRGRRNRGGQGSRQQGSRQQRPAQQDAVAEVPEGPKDGYLGLIERLGNGTGFIRRQHAGYTPSDEDIYVSPKIVSRYDLRTGDEICGQAGRPPRPGKSPPLRYLHTVNGHPPDELGRRRQFDRLSAMHPDRRLRLECGLERRGQPDYTNRIIDLICPMGMGQRSLIVAPAKAGKTMVLQAIAEGISKNHPDSRILILLVDERPEEVTEMEATGLGEVTASSFDHRAERHVQVAEITLERARRLAEMGQDVVLILDSITRLARAYNTTEEGSGRTLTGGIDANSLEKPKRFFGSARCVPESKGGGSLTIIATALVDTGSRMDQVIFEEFKGTGNSELVLDRDISDRRIFPAIDLNSSATRREERLVSDDELLVAQAMRRELSTYPPVEAMQEVLGLMRQTDSNEELVSKLRQRI
ncbi:transcription termination factor Rho [Candidatus Palauibacter soopunensis]|uniref:transcription termination factor Rho n=1 Tax=Candidatus Palauibacter soopunensis TaxID=3056739 RepID=UPI00238A8FA5|nr:transcription termination factor Rho [Candidatus Palauibacter soopunensis]MDE2879574.1 transcription termination factor Rho [Candidatus Palauibacter soopunensis]